MTDHLTRPSVTPPDMPEHKGMGLRAGRAAGARKKDAERAILQPQP